MNENNRISAKREAGPMQGTTSRKTKKHKNYNSKITANKKALRNKQTNKQKIRSGGMDYIISRKRPTMCTACVWGWKFLALRRSEKVEKKLFVCFTCRNFGQLIFTKWRRKRKITVGLEQLYPLLSPCLFFLSPVLGSPERK